MKRSPLKTYARLERRTPLRATSGLKSTTGFSRSKPLRRRVPRRLERDAAERDYVDWLHHQPCVGLRFISGHRCIGPIHQSHDRNMTGLGLKEPARKSVAMCASLHLGQWEAHAGFFVRWTKAERHDWMAARVAEENARYEAETGNRLAEVAA